jgi:hypothetical protein
LKRVVSTYGRIGRTYAKWTPELLGLALIVFVPVGLVDSIGFHAEVESLDLGSGLQFAAALAGTIVLAVTGLLGEVFYSGAVAVSFTHAEHGHSASLQEIARNLRYGRLIAIDLLYGAAVAIGIVLLFAPGIAAFVWLGLAGPVVEIEGRGVRDAFIRSAQLVRGRFWAVLAVLVPIEVAGDALVDLVAGTIHDLLGHSLLVTWFAETATNVLVTPLYAVAAVLLTLDLISEKDGGPSRLRAAASSS